MMRHPAWRLAALATIAVTLSILAAVSGVTPTKLRNAVEDWGMLAPFAYCVLGAALKIALVPNVVVAAGAGLMFGIALGFPVALAAATAGAAFTFVLGRWLGSAALDEVQGRRIARARAWIAERGVLAVIVARVAPIPSGIVDYAGGLTTMPLRTFVAGSLLGFVPRTFAYVAVGESLNDLRSTTMLAAFALVLAVFAAGALIVRRDRRARDVAKRRP